MIYLFKKIEFGFLFIEVINVLFNKLIVEGD